VSEAVEQATYAREVLSEVERAPGTQRARFGHTALGMNIDLLSGSNSLVTTVQRDTGLGADRRFAIVVAGLRETFAPGGEDRRHLSWTPTWRMAADPLTKLISSALLAAFFSGVRGMASDPESKAAALYAMAHHSSARELELALALGRIIPVTAAVTLLALLLATLWAWWGRPALYTLARLANVSTSTPVARASGTEAAAILPLSYAAAAPFCFRGLA